MQEREMRGISGGSMKLRKFSKRLKIFGAAVTLGGRTVWKATARGRKLSMQAMRLALAKDRIVTIRVKSPDFKALKKLALQMGKKYQTYLGEMIHEQVAKRSKTA